MGYFHNHYYGGNIKDFWVAELSNVHIYIYIYVCVCVCVFILEDNTEVDQRISSWRSELDSLDTEYGAI